ncbi:hypothetical protein [Prosthecochloris vibrioformis]|uniref:Uncharacterized protein n=1 Tax=Prosthecochloris vibrioformis TaxID=1098 RepID=A0A5C4RXX0_PROVB|nr:hypothetical protein [Prosthecochloris vibrioformis]TNJ35904.1 hypothetical protein FGF68_09505 [Prosthecochloris vibrioformis]
MFFEHRYLSRLLQGCVVFWHEIPLSSEFFDEDKRHGVQPTYKKVKGFQPLQLTSIWSAVSPWFECFFPP